MQITIREAILNSHRQLLIESVVAALKYAGTPMEAISALYIENLLKEISTYVERSDTDIRGIYHFGFAQTGPTPTIQFFKEEDILENALEIPAYDKLISKLLSGEADLSKNEIDDILTYAPILPTECAMDFDRDLSCVLGTIVHIQDKGSVLSLASEALVRILLARGFVPLNENWNDIFEEDENFWLEDLDDVYISLEEHALSILSCYRMLTSIYHLLEQTAGGSGRGPTMRIGGMKRWTHD